MTDPQQTLITKVQEVLGGVLEPHLRWSVMDLNLLKDVAMVGKSLHVRVNLVTTDPQQAALFQRETTRLLEEATGCSVVLELGHVHIGTRGVDGIARIVFVGSGKGGVGKSCVAVNLAASLTQLGLRVGLLDADVCGPSVPTMLGTCERPEVLPNEYLMPVLAHGIKTMSVGYLVEPHEAMDWRGQMVSGTVLQFVQRTLWGQLDVLVVDLPPGTGDAQMTLAHRLRIDGLLLVTTPQELALGDVRRALSFFNARRVPVLGMVENMGVLMCAHCGKPNHPFPASRRGLGAEGGDIEVLARIPLDPTLAAASDAGTPAAISAGASSAEAFHALARGVMRKLNLGETTANREKSGPLSRAG